MPKILRILNRLNIGGPTLNVTNLSAYLPSNYQTKVLAGFKEEEEGSSEYLLKDKGINYEYVPGMFRAIQPKNDWKAYQYIKNQINEFKPDIVHTHAAKAGALGRLAAHFSKHKPKVIIHTYHGNVFDGYFSPLKSRVFLAIEKYLCSISTGIIAISEQQKIDLSEKYKIVPAHKIHVIRLGFDLDIFTQNNVEKRNYFRTFYKIADDEVVVTITGRLAAVKNHRLFINAVKYMKTLDADLKFKVFIVGDGELFSDTVYAVEEANLTYCLSNQTNYEAEVIFTSWRKDIDIVNAGSDIIALTSINEGTPVSIIEAQASSKAVICTNVGGVKNVVEDGVNGFLCQQNPIEFGDKLYQLAKNAALREQFGNEGNKFALKNYGTDRLIEETERLYSDLLKLKE